MSSQSIRQLVGDTFVFNQIDEKFSEEEITKYRNSLLKQFSTITKNWNDDLHSEPV